MRTLLIAAFAVVSMFGGGGTRPVPRNEIEHVKAFARLYGFVRSKRTRRMLFSA